MADSEPEDMPSSSITPEMEWSTREKLAIASYVARTGEQRWSGAGRILRPLGEPGRPADWFSPKHCAQQYTALMGQLDVPKRKRGGERSDLSENIEPSTSPEDAIIARLTKQRIEELKKQLRQERNRYRKLKREKEMVESGELDDQLDELLKEIHDRGKEAESVEVKEVSFEKVETQLDESSGVQNINMDVEEKDAEAQPKAQSEIGESEETVTASTDESSDAVEQMETTAVAPAADSTDTDVLESSEPVLGSLPATEESEDLKESTIFSGSQQKEPTVMEEEATEDESDAMTNLADKPNESCIIKLEETLTDNEESQEAELVTETTMAEVNTEEPVLTGEQEVSEPAKEEQASTGAVAEEMETYNVSLDDDMKQSISLPGTPAQSNNFFCDSFPSSPALSHSSDMDPDATASWKAWRKSIMILWKQVASHRYASLFLQPVTDDIAPNYSTTVLRSTDLATIKKNIESGVIRTTSEFCRDVMLMLQNAIMYNNSEHDVFKWTKEMQKDVMNQITQFRATQMMVETTQPQENKSLRRSTMRRSAMSEKTGQTRARRSAVAESDAKTSH